MRAVTLANGMARRGDVHNLILALNGDLSCTSRFSPDVSFESVSIKTPVLWHGLPGRVHHYRRELQRLKPDLLVTYNWGSIEWAAANVMPVCPHVHVEDGFGPEEAGGQIFRRVLFRRLVLSRHARTALPSHTLFDIARDVWRLPPERLCYIPNGIDLAPYGAVSQGAARKAFGLPSDGLVIGTLATLRREKNLMRLIEAFVAVRQKVPCHLVIAGEGKERSALEARCAALGLDGAVSFTGFVKTPAALLPAFDIFALSSDTEQMPLSVMEAMATGLPVASLDVGDVRHMVARPGRKFVAGRDLMALIENISGLLDPDARMATGFANKELAMREFDAVKMIASWEELFTFG